MKIKNKWNVILDPWLEIITQESQNKEKNSSRVIKILSTQKEHKARIFPKSKKIISGRRFQAFMLL